MPRQKDLKRLVRARMQKTGEAYTTARSQILRKPRVKRTSTPTTKPKPRDYAQLAGMSDAKIKEKTGCSWERWVKSLDHHGAAQMSHRDIARLVYEKYKIDGWWSQTVTVGYERIKGLRARGQRRDGTYEVNKSRTINVAVTKLFDAWAEASVRRRWLGDATVQVRAATAPKAIRFDWADGTIVVGWFTPKGKSKSVVALAHTKLPDKATSDRLKQYWSERLDALREVVAGE